MLSAKFPSYCWFFHFPSYALSSYPSHCIKVYHFVPIFSDCNNAAPALSRFLIGRSSTINSRGFFKKNISLISSIVQSTTKLLIMAFETYVQTPTKNLKNILKSFKKMFKAGNKRTQGRINYSFDADSSALGIICNEFIFNRSISTEEEFDNEINERLEAEYNLN